MGDREHVTRLAIASATALLLAFDIFVVVFVGYWIARMNAGTADLEQNIEVCRREAGADHPSSEAGPGSGGAGADNASSAQFDLIMAQIEMLRAGSGLTRGVLSCIAANALWLGVWLIRQTRRARVPR